MTDELTLEDIERLTIKNVRGQKLTAFEIGSLIHAARAHIEAKGGDVGELVERLQRYVNAPIPSTSPSYDHIFRDCGKAAATLTAQQSALAAKDAEIVALRESLDKALEANSLRRSSMGDVEYPLHYEGPTVEELENEARTAIGKREAK